MKGYSMNDFITVVGGGLAGSEAAYQIAKRGIKVKLYEMKPNNFSPAHSNNNLAEIVCSNSFKSNLHTNACGLLKEELRNLDSLLIKVADETAVPAGQALAVDREVFSKKVTEALENMKNVEIIRQEVGKDGLSIESIAKDGIVIIATGPLTSDALSKQILELTGEDDLHFYDAAAPIIFKDSIDMNIAFYGNRYEQERAKDEDVEEWKTKQKNDGDASYINLPMNKEEYEHFWNELVNAEVVELHQFEKREIFEGCMPVEVMAKRGIDTLRYGPLKPMGFTDPRTGYRPYALVQLRQDNKDATIYNIVGFQTNLKFGEQKRVFSMIPGLENAEFAKYAFNKSHAACYALVAYRTAYLKCYYPAEFMAALMTSVLDQSNKIARYTAECKRLGIRLASANINTSMQGFTPNGRVINYGLLGIKNVGREFVDDIVKERENGDCGGEKRALSAVAEPNVAR